MKALLPLKYTKNEKLQATRRYLLMVIYVLHTTFKFGDKRIVDFMVAMSNFADEANENDTWQIEIEDWCYRHGIEI